MSIPHLSHATQRYKNYFDHKDVRVRQAPYTIDAQLLNMAACGLDQASLRIARELSASTLASCPTELDNRGIYYALPLDSSYQVATTATSLPLVQGTTGGVTKTLTPYDDELPVPASYVKDPERSLVYIPEPQIINDTIEQDNLVQNYGPFAMPIPNTLTFFVDVAEPVFFANIVVTGVRYPAPVWADQVSTFTESLDVTLRGSISTITTWASITKVVVRGLPAGAKFKAWSIPFQTPFVRDSLRPYIHPTFRYAQYPRYWMITSAGLLEETYIQDNLEGPAYIQSYSMPEVFSDVAVEANTWGAVGVAGTQIYYFDRREPLPTNLDVTALSTEPLFGLDCHYNPDRPGSARFLTFTPVAYGGAAKIQSWRYLVEDPNGNLFALLPDGTYGIYTGGAGWQTGSPVELSIPLVLPGTYVITLECYDVSGNVTHDSFPYPNLALSTQAIDLSSIVPQIQGVAFDSRQQLWIWTGTFAFPLKPVYNGYILDAPNHMLYLTDSFDSVQYE